MNRQIPRPEHPNPQWERENWVNLNGEWEFEIDHCASGFDRELHLAPSLSGKITLPFCPESPLSGVGHKDFMMSVWYKRTLSFTKEELEGKRVIFHIGASDFLTRVYVNGKIAGLPHVGGYCSFEYDITDLLTEGDNIVTIWAYDDTRSPGQPCGKQSATHYSIGCHYTRTTGIWQTVWYEIVPEGYISYARFYPDAENCSLTINADLVGKGDLSATVYYDGKKVGEASKKNLSVNGSLEIALSEKHLWELGDGKLYTVELRFGEDKVSSYFGLRSIEIKKGVFYLNGRPVFQRLILDQGFYPDGICTAPTEDALIKDIEISMAAGFNGARLHQKVFEPRFLYNADRLGYMVWGEYANWGIDYSDVANLATFIPDWLGSVKRDFNHPAIVGWCPLNETWDYGPQRKRQDNNFHRWIYEATKLLDTTRPCIDTSGNYHVVTDIYDVHDYDQDPVTFKARYDMMFTEGVLKERHNERQKWPGKDAIFISEYGGIGFQLLDNDSKKAWSYGKATTSYEEFYARYKGLTDAMLDNPLVMGFCYTQLTDVEQEVNGLYTYEGRNPKFDIDILREINTRKAAIEE